MYTIFGVCAMSMSLRSELVHIALPLFTFSFGLVRFVYPFNSDNIESDKHTHCDMRQCDLGKS